MNKKLQVFISSTYTDLIEERQAAVEAILDAGHIPAGMELFKGGKSQMKTVQKWIDDSDVYMLLLGGRYGSIDAESKLSYTEIEYKYALSKKMPVFAVVLQDDYLKQKERNNKTINVSEKDNIAKYNAFKTIVKSNVVKFASNIDQIKTNIHSQLNDMLKDSDYALSGWIKANSLTSDIDTTLPPNIIESPLHKCLRLYDSGIYICPACWYSKKIISVINVDYREAFTCDKCGFRNY